MDLSKEDTLALVESSIDESAELLPFTTSISAMGFKHFEMQWVESLRNLAMERRWDSRLIGSLLVALPDVRKTWSVVESFGEEVNEFFWRNKHPFHLNGSLDDLLFAVQKYLGLGRALAAIAAVHQRNTEIPSSTLLSLLDAAVPEINASLGADTMTSYYVEALFETLEKRCDIPAEDMARREFAYLPLIDGKKESLTLHRLLVQQPEFYISVICTVFHPATGEAPIVSDEQRRLASAAYGLLSGLKELPGQHAADVDEQVLLAWCIQVRASAREVDRLQITDQYIGRLLAHSPASKIDNAWPHKSVRAAIERLSSEDIETGILIERHNMRGVFSRALGEGGKQERAFADQARQWAEIASDTPRTSAMLHRISDSWAEYAEQEDIRAEKDELRL